jgi:hypothetical protein
LPSSWLFMAFLDVACRVDFATPSPLSNCNQDYARCATL